MAENQTDWAGILGSALAGYFANRGTSGGTPNFYPVPLTPEEKRWDDARWDVYQQGGSPQMKAAGSAAQQFFGGLPTTANPTFASPMMRGQAFAGGVQLPKIDLSKFDFTKPIVPSTSTTPDKPHGPGPQAPGGMTDDDKRNARDYGYGSRTDDPLNPAGGGGPLGPNPGGIDNMPTPGEQGYKPQSPSEFAGSVSQWWEDYKKAHPNWMAQGGLSLLQGAVSAVFGPLGTAAMNFIRNHILNNGSGGNGGSSGDNKFNDFYENPLAYKGGYDQAGYGFGATTGLGGNTGKTSAPSGGSTTAGGSINGAWVNSGYGSGWGDFGSVAPRATPQRGGYQINPRTGQVTRSNPDNSFAGQRQDYWNDAFWRGLQGPPGSGPTPSSGAAGQYGNGYGGSTSNENGSSAEMPWNAWRPRV